MDIKNKTIVVTGGSDGIGREIVLSLAKKGANLAIIARSQDKLSKVLQEVQALGSTRSSIYSCDLSDQAQIKTTIVQIVADYDGKISGLINNAGIWQKKAQLDEIEDEMINQTIQVDLLGLIYVTKALLPTLRLQPEAAIINVSSRSGITAQTGQAVYTAAKWGVKGFTQVLKEDLAETNIHVAGVYQGGTNTQMFHKAGETWPQEKLASFIRASDLGELVAHIMALPAQIWVSEIHVENK